MATSPVITGAQTRAPSKVTRLPTAAARKAPWRFLSGAELAKRGIVRILRTVEVIDPRRSYSAAFIVAEAILAQLPREQRRGAQNAVHRLYQEIGTEEARAASAFMAGLR